ncbi:polysaccharide lyase [Vitiosangium sp. GDMCC 1.1324]|uniref:polysaccharide lyase n=1 Tax=Vitiosangium sp. (strain GDMCC 1.1324) TaxID=2138576 RepID=UPI001E5EEE9F|nr:polysaccharide lyase [Vitiosangium sp. GDMCC 1.1324]
MTLPLTALASPVWKADYETGNLSQWSGRESVASDRLQVVTSPTREGKYALKVTVKKGDDPINASGNRNELFHFGNETEGSEYYYKWSTQFASDFPSVNTWQLFTQWHHDGSNGSPPLEFYVRGERIYLRLEGRDDRIVWNTPLVRGQWLDFVLHVKWSSDPNIGFVELYYNGQLVLPRMHSPTMFQGMQNYLKQGLYRDESVNPDGVVYHDGMVQATSLEDVMPTKTTPPPPPPAVATQPPANSGPPAPATSTSEPPSPSVAATPDTVGVVDPNALAGQPSGGCSAAGGPLGGLGLLFSVLGFGVRAAFGRRSAKRD